MGGLPGAARLLTLARRLLRWEASDTFERFSEGGRQVIVLAQEEGRELGHDFIGTEHLLLGVIREHDSDAARALREVVVRTLPPPGSAERAGPSRRSLRGGPRAHPVSARLVPSAEAAFLVQLSPEARRLLTSAAARALDDGRTEISIADVEEALRRRPPEAAAG